MLKTAAGFFCLLFFGFMLSASAQKTDSLRVDTNLLNKYRLEPGRNSLPVIFRPVQIGEQLMPVTMLDYNISYWHKSVIFGLNFNQSAFTSNYSAGGISAVALGSNFDYKAEYNKKPLDFTTELNLIYGISK
jgi:hypothetical protein